MADKPQSPFTGLDRALLRSTKAKQADAPHPDQTPAPIADGRMSDSQQEARKLGARQMTASILASDAELVEAIRKTVKVTEKKSDSSGSR